MLLRTPEVIILHVLLFSSYFSLTSSTLITPHNVFQSVGQTMAHIHTTFHARRPMAREFLRAHNTIRAKYGTPPLVWDRSLARFARRHAAKLAKDCSMVHSEGGQYGENLFWGKLDHWTPTKMVENWADESQYFDRKTNKCKKDWTECGHFTQVVWAGTRRVGCRRQKCQGEAGFIGVCNYYPPGNGDDQSPFN